MLQSLEYYQSLEYIQSLELFVSQLAGWMWGAPLLILLFGTHIFLTFQLRGIQF
ncbi:MAG: hypothetical protein HN663_00410, partial [Nitrosomonadales bacterium]|nr:hypothetical protein [Nitrosomonadales bacterium]